MIKLRPDDHSLGKKGGGLAIYINNTIPAFKIEALVFENYDEILWVFAKPKRLPSHYNGIAFCVFYYSSGKDVSSQ